MGPRAELPPQAQASPWLEPWGLRASMREGLGHDRRKEVGSAETPGFTFGLGCPQPLRGAVCPRNFIFLLPLSPGWPPGLEMLITEV